MSSSSHPRGSPSAPHVALCFGEAPGAAGIDPQGRYSSAAAAGKKTKWSHFLPLEPLTLVTRVPLHCPGWEEVLVPTHPCVDLPEQLPVDQRVRLRASTS